MESNSITINQAFYGEVNKAHSCIKETIIDPDLTSFLIAFTDRPAALPPGVNLLPYLSGAAYSNYYVLTKTFADDNATRSGMVFTHALIVNLTDIININDLQKIFSLFVESPDAKSVDLVELKVEGVDSLSFPERNRHYKFAQEVISAFITGVKPILFSGDISLFSNAIQYLWNSPNIEHRERIKFRTSFTPSDIDNSDDLTIVSIQKDFLSKWQGKSIIYGGLDSVEITSYSESLFLGHKSGNPLYDFLTELGVDLSQVQAYGQYDELFQNFSSISKLEDSNAIRQNIRLLSKISPSSSNGKNIKEKFIDRLSRLIIDEKDSNIKALRNIDWSSFSDGEKRGKEVVFTFIRRELVNPKKNQIQSFSEIIDLTVNETPKNWWHDSVIQAVTSEFKVGTYAALQMIWGLIDTSQKDLINILAILKSVPECDKILRWGIPHSLRHETCTLMISIAEKNFWYLLHADILLKQFSVPISLEKQLKFEENLSLEDSLGVKYLGGKLKPEDLIEFTLNSYDKKLVELSTAEIIKDKSLMQRIGLKDPCWLSIWTSVVLKTRKLFVGLEGNEQLVVDNILDLILQGVRVDDQILDLISDSDFSDLSDYQNRAKIWGLVSHSQRNKFLIATSRGVLNELINGKVEGSSIESDLSDFITSVPVVTKFLSDNRNSIDPIIKFFSNFPNLRDAFLADYITYYSNTITLTQAEQLGKLINLRHYTKSARSIYDKAKYNITFRPAYEICKGLVKLNWLESIFGPYFPKESETRPVVKPALTLTNEESHRKGLPTVVILTAIKEEYLAVRSHLKEIVEADRNDTNYEAGIFDFQGREVAKVFIRECGPKNTTASQETERAIQYFHPDAMFFVGIAGSRKPNDFAIGDVIFPEKVYSYEGGKSEKDSFYARPDIADLTYTVKELAKKERRRDHWKALIKGNWRQDFKADLGIIASGEQVIEHYDSQIGEILSKHYNDTSAIEMEGFGFAKAANRQGRETNKVLIGIVRGISDVIEQSKKGKSKEVVDRRPANAKVIASDTASAFAFWLILKLFDNFN